MNLPKFKYTLILARTKLQIKIDQFHKFLTDIWPLIDLKIFDFAQYPQNE